MARCTRLKSRCLPPRPDLIGRFIELCCETYKKSRSLCGLMWVASCEDSRRHSIMLAPHLKDPESMFGDMKPLLVALTNTKGIQRNACWCPL